MLLDELMHFDARDAAMRLNRRVVSVRCDMANDCSVCLAPLRGRVVFVRGCGHALHLRCEQQLKSSNGPWRSRCPTCRHSFEEDCAITEEEIVRLLLEIRGWT